MNEKVTVLYQRLSKDDIASEGDSKSIINQRDMLVKYAEQNGYTPYICLSDDGKTGTNFLRPGWAELMELVEADKVGAIILKSLDRMGRNYLEAGMLREMFAEKGIRLIAINDGVDTFDRQDDFIPFREIMAEYYARDTSRKIKSVLKNKGRDGKPLSNIPPYGFVKDPQDKTKWQVDPIAAAVVRRIFNLAVEGNGPYEISRILHDEKIERPSYYYMLRAFPMMKFRLQLLLVGLREGHNTVLSHPVVRGVRNVSTTAYETQGTVLCVRRLRCSQNRSLVF